MPNLSEKALKEFKELYKQKFNEDLTDEELVYIANSIMLSFSLIYRPVRKEWIK